jgi:hypothetical protein
MPTDIKQLHHDEQMEAARSDFDELWATKLKRLLISCNVHRRANDADLAFIKLACWHAFRAGMERKTDYETD